MNIRNITYGFVSNKSEHVTFTVWVMCFDHCAIHIGLKRNYLLIAKCIRLNGGKYACTSSDWMGLLGIVPHSYNFATLERLKTQHCSLKTLKIRMLFGTVWISAPVTYFAYLIDIYWLSSRRIDRKWMRQRKCKAIRHSNIEAVQFELSVFVDHASVTGWKCISSISFSGCKKNRITTFCSRSE